MKKLIVLASLSLIFSAASAAQRRQSRATPTVDVDPKLAALPPKVNAEEAVDVDRILQKYLDAQRGARSLASVRTRIMRGTVIHSQSNHPGSVEYYSKAPRKTLTVVQVPGVGQFIEAYDGRGDWMSNPITGSVSLEQATVVILDRESEFGRMPKASKMYSSVTYKGRSRVGNREAHVVEALRDGSAKQVLYFDTASGLLVRSDVAFRAALTKKDVPVRINYEHYAKVDGIMFPTTIEHIFPDYTITFKIYEVKHNVHIDDSMFERPQASPAPAPGM